MEDRVAETSLLQGKITEDPANQDIEVEKLLRGLLRSLLEEQTDGPGREAAPIVSLAPERPRPEARTEPAPLPEGPKIARIPRARSPKERQ
jgi:hypothetical protein